MWRALKERDVSRLSEPSVMVVLTSSVIMVGHSEEESIWKKVWSMKRSKASFFQARRVYWYPLRLLNSWMQAR
ncbi:hypothetical protein EYF80_032093 [Liparis tanakae]|uniref:Uncharacterized protein n=1 Tax=Liparis tanakae TaxID=230148 RepID=A0A4Z2GX86_9TELE|nr:hypothetical protein EYF80_032093 [Liparis tanakae]